MTTKDELLAFSLCCNNVLARMNSEEDLAMMMPGPLFAYIFTSIFTSYGATPADTYIYDEGIFTSQK